jgi:hypothetical protein
VRQGLRILLNMASRLDNQVGVVQLLCVPGLTTAWRDLGVCPP